MVRRSPFAPDPQRRAKPLNLHMQARTLEAIALGIERLHERGQLLALDLCGPAST